MGRSLPTFFPGRGDFSSLAAALQRFFSELRKQLGDVPRRFTQELDLRTTANVEDVFNAPPYVIISLPDDFPTPDSVDVAWVEEQAASPGIFIGGPKPTWAHVERGVRIRYISGLNASSHYKLRIVVEG